MQQAFQCQPMLSALTLKCSYFWIWWHFIKQKINIQLFYLTLGKMTRFHQVVCFRIAEHGKSISLSSSTLFYFAFRMFLELNSKVCVIWWWVKCSVDLNGQKCHTSFKKMMHIGMTSLNWGVCIVLVISNPPHRCCVSITHSMFYGL